MKRKNYIKTGLYVLLILTIVSCSKKENTENNDPGSAESITNFKDEIEGVLPDALLNSTNEYAQNAVAWINTVTDWSMFGESLKPPADAVQYGVKSAMAENESYTWSYNYGEYSFSMLWEYYEEGDKKYWDVSIKYLTDDWYKYMEAWESKTGFAGEIKFNYQWACVAANNEECIDLFWKYTWGKTSTGAYKLNYIIESNEDDVENALNYEVLINLDGSGYVNYYLEDELFYEIEWDVEGNGSWAYYFGDSEITGEWTVE